MPAPTLLTDAQVQAYLTNGYITVQTALRPGRNGDHRPLRPFNPSQESAHDYCIGPASI